MQDSNHSLLIFVRGLPGSGKSYISRALAEAIAAATDRSITVLDPDATDYDSEAYHQHIVAQLGEGVDPTLHAYRFLRAQAYEAIAKHGVVIWNQPFTNLEIFNQMVGRMREQASASGTTADIIVVEVAIDPTVVARRVADRKAAGGHGPSDETFERFVRDYKTFANDGYNVVAVRGEDPLETVTAAIMDAVQPLL